MNTPNGIYESAYTMNADEEILIVNDRITFIASEKSAIGIGERDEDGLRMRLSVEPEGTSITGSWEEHDEAGRIVLSGQVEFMPDTAGRLVGYWSIAEDNNKAAGTWVLVKTLGHTASQG